MNSNGFPRTVVVSSTPFAADASNGPILKSLFKGWPREKLAQVYFPVGQTSAPDHAYCSDYRRVNLSGRVETLSPASDHDAPSSAGLVSSLASLAKKRLPQHNRLRPLVEATRVALPTARLLAGQLRELGAERVYALLGNGSMCHVVPKACAAAGVPFYAHVTDDFVTSLYRGAVFGSVASRLSEAAFRRAANRSSGRAGISPLMAEEYGDRYGGDWDWFTTLVEPEQYSPGPREPDGVLRLVYSGGLGIGRWRSLRDVALGLARVADRLGVEARLDVYTTPEHTDAYRDAIEATGVAKMKGWIDSSRLPDVLHNSDLLLHVESFDEDMAAYTRLSFSTKLSQYMMSSRCVLAAAPEQTGSSRMIRRTNSGVLAGSTSPDSLDPILTQLLKDGAARRARGENGRRYAERWFSAKTNRERFQQAMIGAAGGASPAQNTHAAEAA